MRSRIMLFLFAALLASTSTRVTAWRQRLVSDQDNVSRAPRLHAPRGERGVGIETRSTGVEDLPAEDRILDQADRKRLRVTWEKPRRKVYERASRRESCLEITGKLSLLQADGKTLKAVDWPYPIQVVITRRPNEKPDWTRWYDPRDSLSSGTLVGREFMYDTPRTKKPVGVFSAGFPLSEIETAVGTTMPFQVGLSFGEKKGNMVTWSNISPILPQSVKMLDVPGPKPLSRTLQLINACPTPIDWNYDPIALVRATNHLQSLGKDKAIAAMREFLELADDPVPLRRRIDPTNIDTSNQWCLASIVPLVFDGVREREDIRVWQGIPFHTVVIRGFSRPGPVSSRPLVDEAARIGTSRKKPLRPADNPLEAADALFDKIVEEGGGFRQERLNHLRRQAWTAIRHLVDPGGKQSPDFSSQESWDKLKAKVTQMKIRWDEKRQEYVAGEKGK
jgi:hypothetical protein